MGSNTGVKTSAVGSWQDVETSPVESGTHVETSEVESGSWRTIVYDAYQLILNNIH